MLNSAFNNPLNSRLNRALVALVAFGLGGSAFAATGLRVAGRNIRIEFDGALHSRVVALIDGQERILGDFTPSEFLRISGKDVADFSLKSQKHERVQDWLGSGMRTIIIGTAPTLKKTIAVTMYDQ